MTPPLHQPAASTAVGFGGVMPQEDGIAVVELQGELSAGGRGALRDRLVTLLRTHCCVLLDLNRLRVASTRALGVLSAALDQAGGWPDARLGVFTGDRLLRQTLQSSGTADYLWVAHNVALARARCLERPRRVRATWSATPGPDAPGRMRALVSRRWSQWGLSDDTIDEAMMVVNELVSNAVDHARTAFRVQLVYDGALLRIRVRDQNPDPPRLQPLDVTAARGRGLQMVDALAVRWGWARHDDGKTVWAALATA